MQQSSLRRVSLSVGWRSWIWTGSYVVLDSGQEETLKDLWNIVKVGDRSITNDKNWTTAQYIYHWWIFYKSSPNSYAWDVINGVWCSSKIGFSGLHIIILLLRIPDIITQCPNIPTVIIYDILVNYSEVWSEEGAYSSPVNICIILYILALFSTFFSTTINYNVAVVFVLQ